MVQGALCELTEQYEEREQLMVDCVCIGCGSGRSRGLSKDVYCAASSMAHTLRCSASAPHHRHFQLHWRTSAEEGRDADNSLTTTSREMITKEGLVYKTSLLHVNPPLKPHSVQCYWCELTKESAAGEAEHIATSSRVCMYGRSGLAAPLTCKQNVTMAEFNIFCRSPADMEKGARRVIRQANQSSPNSNSNAVTTATTILLSSTLETELSTSQENIAPSTTTATTVSRSDGQSSTPATTTSITSVPQPTTSSILPTPVPSPEVHSNPDYQAPPTSAASLSSLPPSTEAGTPSQSGTVEGGPLAAIALCVVFISAIIFIFLITMIIHLSRNKCGCCRNKKEEDLERRMAGK